jgi:hypothetical protein
VLRVGQRVRFSGRGAERVRSMPEAWGLHRALYAGEEGEVVEVCAPEEGASEDALPGAGEPGGGEGPRVSVEFPGGGAYNWEAACFEPCGPGREGEAER